MSDVSGFLTGLTNSLNSYLGTQLSAQNQMAMQKQQIDYQKQADYQEKSQLQQDEYKRQSQLATDKVSNEGKITPEIAEQILPGAGGSMIQNFQKANGRLPSTIEAKSFLEEAVKKLSADNAPDKNAVHQDMLEKNFNDRLTTVKGDQSLMRTERQRDAAAMAYDTITKATSEKRDLTELEQTDLIAQLFQARNGKSPTEEDMKSLNEKTGKRGFNHMVTYLTGNPSLVGASTKDTLANLKQFVESTGSKADEQWGSYMGPRMNPPTGLDKDRVDHVLSQHRGLSFADQKTTSDKTFKSSSQKTSSGWSYVGPVK